MRRLLQSLHALVLVAGLALATTAAHARFTPEVHIEGNSRTRSSYVRNRVHDCLETQGVETLAAVDIPALEQCTIDSELFSSVTVMVDTTVRIAVEERWTLIPVPFFQSQQDTRRAGLFLIESNLLGWGKLLVAGATFGNRGNSYLLVLKDPAIASGDWTVRTVLRRGDEDLYRYAENDKVDGFQQQEGVVRVQPGYRWTPDLELGWFGEYVDRHYRAADPFTTDPVDTSYGNTGPAVEYDRTRYRFYFREGHKTRLRLGRQFARSGGGAEAASYELEHDWQFPLLGNNVLKLNLVGAGTSSSDLRDSLKLGGDGPLRGVERDGLWVRHAVGASVDYQVPLWQGRFGTWAAGPFACYARYRQPEGGGWQSSRALGAGLFLYLKKIALPGIGVAAGYNPDFTGGFVDIQVGFGF
ncbi:MAG: hypothetical protein P1P84_21980 [Deferrisomatales bacterium]|nr:hypothetical protein [Deferrisomatales bacterium]